MTSAALSANSTMSVLTAARQLSAANRILLLSSHPAAAAPAPCLTPPRRSQYTHTSQDLGTRKDRMDFWGWLGYGRPGYPRTTPLRTPGVDPNLQERLDEMFAERNARRERRRDVGFAPAKVRTLANDRRRAAEWRRQRREDAGLERAARNRTLEVDLDDVKREQRDSGALYHDIREAADLYGIYDDLFDLDSIFTPCLDLRVEFDYDDEYFTPVYRGNIIKPSEAKTEPSVGFNLPENMKEEGEETLWTLTLTNPDGHFTDENAEYLHWMVGNIKGTDFSSGETVVDYLQPFPPYGTGFHRYVFLLYKQSAPMDFSHFKREAPCRILSERTFSTSDFHRNSSSTCGAELTPAGLSFFQSDWDSSLKDFFHNGLNMKEPRYEYHFLQPYVTPWGSLFHHRFRDGFNLFLDRYRDPKEIQEELVRKKLADYHPFKGDLTRATKKFPNAHIIDWRLPQWRRREIERERLRQGIYKDLDWGHLRRDPTHA